MGRQGPPAGRTFHSRASHQHAQEKPRALPQLPSSLPPQATLLVLILQAAKLQAGVKAQRDLGEHIRQLLLNQLVPGQRDTKLDPRQARLGKVQEQVPTGPGSLPRLPQAPLSSPRPYH